MKTRQFLCWIFIVMVGLPILSNAEIYKWKDKNGNMQYSDVPPTRGNARVLGKEKPEPILNTKATDEASSEAAKTTPDKKPELKEVVDPEAEAEARRIREKNAEIERSNQKQAEQQAKFDEESCRAAKANKQQFVQGGRVYKTNVSGEREYMSDADLKAGIQKAQADINKYCK